MIATGVSPTRSATELPLHPAAAPSIVTVVAPVFGALLATTLLGACRAVEKPPVSEIRLRMTETATGSRSPRLDPRLLVRALSANHTVLSAALRWKRVE